MAENDGLTLSRHNKMCKYIAKVCVCVLPFDVMCDKIYVNNIYATISFAVRVRNNTFRE